MLFWLSFWVICWVWLLLFIWFIICGVVIWLVCIFNIVGENNNVLVIRVLDRYIICLMFIMNFFF